MAGARFGILQLPGHSAGHIGIVTPDGAAYLGDCLIDHDQIAAAKLPTSMFIARDLESKQRLHELDAPAYIVAHKQVLTERAAFDALIDENIAFIHAKERELLDDLTDGMTFSDWIAAFCRREDIRTHNELKFSVVERNFSNFAAWLTDIGASPSSGSSAPSGTTAPDAPTAKNRTDAQRPSCFLCIQSILGLSLP